MQTVSYSRPHHSDGFWVIVPLDYIPGMTIMMTPRSSSCLCIARFVPKNPKPGKAVSSVFSKFSLLSGLLHLPPV